MVHLGVFICLPRNEHLMMTAFFAEYPPKEDIESNTFIMHRKPFDSRTNVSYSCCHYEVKNKRL